MDIPVFTGTHADFLVIVSLFCVTQKSYICLFFLNHAYMRVIHQGQDVQSWVNPLTHSDQDRISPCNINTIK